MKKETIKISHLYCPRCGTEFTDVIILPYTDWIACGKCHYIVFERIELKNYKEDHS